MKKLMMLLSASLLLVSCGEKGSDAESEGASAKGSTIELSGVKAPLDKFELKSSTAFKSGMAWSGGKILQPVLYVAVSSADKIEYVKMFNNIDMPKKDGETTILFRFSGKKFNKGEEPSTLAEGEYPIGEASFDGDQQSSSSNVYAMIDGEKIAANLSMQSSTSAKDFTGVAKITKLTDELVEGTIEFTGADGMKCKLTFSEKIEHDFWASDFKGGK